jgi:hypothetical protein
LHDARDLVGVASGPDAELAIRRRQVELPEEDGGQLVVVVLARVKQDFVVPGSKPVGNGRSLHELGTVPDDCD